MLISVLQSYLRDSKIFIIIGPDWSVVMIISIHMSEIFEFILQEKIFIILGQDQPCLSCHESFFLKVVQIPEKLPQFTPPLKLITHNEWK